MLKPWRIATKQGQSESAVRMLFGVHLPATKKAKFIVRYKKAVQQHHVLARRAAELLDISYKERKDDASFLGKGNTSSSDDRDLTADM